MGSASLNHTLEGNEVFALHVRKMGGGTLHNTNLQGNVNGCMVKRLQRFATSYILEFMFLIHQKEKENIIKGFFKSHNTIRTTSKNKTL